MGRAPRVRPDQGQRDGTGCHFGQRRRRSRARTERRRHHDLLRIHPQLQPGWQGRALLHRGIRIDEDRRVRQRQRRLGLVPPRRRKRHLSHWRWRSSPLSRQALQRAVRPPFRADHARQQAQHGSLRGRRLDVRRKVNEPACSDRGPFREGGSALTRRFRFAFVVAAMAAAFCAMPAQGAARDNSWELGGFAGYAILDDPLDNSFTWGGRAGYNFQGGHELEFALEFFPAEVDETIAGINLSLDVDITTMTLGYLYNWEHKGNVSPF